jgi:hypothetical protein
MKINIFTLLLLTCFFVGTGFTAPAPVPEKPLHFERTPDAAALEFSYGLIDDVYLETMRDRYGIDRVVQGKATDLERAQAVCLWVYNRLEHDGHAALTITDPMAILQEAQLRNPTQCVGFGIVLAAALQSIGIPARPLYLKAADCETSASASGHAATEAWLSEQQKWVLIDAQWDIIPMLGDTPLNAVELQQAITDNNPNLTYLTSIGTKGKFYFRWLKRMLYYFDTPLDNRYGVDKSTAELMLVPVGAKKPKVFQRTTALHNMHYTSSVASFYAEPHQVYHAQEEKTPSN